MVRFFREMPYVLILKMYMIMRVPQWNIEEFSRFVRGVKSSLTLFAFIITQVLLQKESCAHGRQTYNFLSSERQEKVCKNQSRSCELIFFMISNT